MKLLAPVVIAFSLFSRLPMPQVEWSEENTRYLLCAFPLVGLVQGGFALLWSRAVLWLSLPSLLWAVGMTLLPLFVNGGIHLDGLCDTADARASHADREKKLSILADPHLGAFGGMTLACHLLLLLGLFSALIPSTENLLCLLCIYVLSRSWSGYAVLRLPSAKSDGMAHSFTRHDSPAAPARILLVIILMVSGCMIALTGWIGLAVAVASALIALRYRWMAIREFGGVTGDLAGWFLQTAELWMLGVLVLGGHIQ